MGDPELREVERQAHAIYGLVIITAALVADRESAENALVSLLGRGARHSCSCSPNLRGPAG